MALTYDSIATTTLGASSQTITFSSIPQTYTDLKIVFFPVTTAGSMDSFYWTANGDVPGVSSIYTWSRIRVTGTTVAGSTAINDTAWGYTGIPGIAVVPPSATGGSCCIIEYLNYSNTTLIKSGVASFSADINTTSGTSQRIAFSRNSTAAISSLTFYCNNFATGTMATIYGIKAA